MKLIAIDKNDNFLGLVDKIKAHRKKGILHRAFSIFIFNDKKELLLQKRSKYKSLWPLYWSNTCCSHPNAKNLVAKNAKKDLIKQAEKRLEEEMGFTCLLKPLFKFYYQASYQDKGSENELSVILAGKYKGQKIISNKKEVSDYHWISFKKLKKEIKSKPEIFTPWFKKIIKDKRFLLTTKKFK